MADIPVGPVAGKDCKAYYNSGTHATPTWVEIVRGIDFAVPDYGVNPVEANSRESNFEAFVAGLIKVGLTFTYLHSRGADSVRDALVGMVAARSSKEFAFMDGGITLVGARGVRMFGLMEKFSQSQDLEGKLVWDASLKPAHVIEASAKVDPDLYIVAS
jgi:hypothetical protein